MNRKEEISKGCGKLFREETYLGDETNRIAKCVVNQLCPTCQVRLDERIRAEAETQEILLEHTQLTYEVGKLKEQLTELNAKNQSHITRQRNELARLQSPEINKQTTGDSQYKTAEGNGVDNSTTGAPMVDPKQEVRCFDTSEQTRTNSPIEIKDMAIRLHNSYEMWSKKYLWKTQSICNEKEFDELPEKNKMVMLAMGNAILDLINKARLDERIRAEQDFLKELDLDKVLSENKHLPYGITEKVLNHIKSKIKKQ